MTTILSAFSVALLHFAWQGLLVFVLLRLALFALRNHSPNARYLASCVALAVLAAAPLVTTYFAYQPHAPATFTRAAAFTPAAVQPVVAPPSPRTAWFAAVQPWVLPAWALGVLLFSMRMVWGCAQVSALRRRGRPVDAAVRSMIANLSGRLGLSAPAQALISEWAGGPSLVGWLRPVILIPASALAGLTPEQLEAVLAHELAHIQRHDYLVNWLQMLVETLLFYHPAVWWISSRIRHERELCCDDLAVTACGGPLCYARALTTLEKLRAATPTLAVGSTGGALLYRIQRITGASAEQYGPSRAAGIGAFALALACLVLSVNWAHGQNQAPREYLAQGDVLLRAGANDQALQKYREGMALDPANLVVYQKRCIEVLMRMDRRSAAFELNAQILKAHPDDTDALGLQAVNMLDHGDVSAAVALLQQVTQRAPDNPVARLDLGLAYSAQHEDVAARREIEAAIRMRPDFTRARQALEKLDVGTPPHTEAVSLMNAGKYDEAIYAYQKTLDGMDPGSQNRVEVYVHLSEAYQRKGDAGAAVQALEKARELAPRNRAVLIALPPALEAVGRTIEADRIRVDNQIATSIQAELTTNFLKAELAVAEKRLETLQSSPQRDPESIRQAQVSVAEMKRKLQASETPIVGRVVAVIDVAGIPIRLPVHLGDTLTPATIEATQEAVHAYDSSLGVQMEPLSDGTVQLKIVKPRR